MTITTIAPTTTTTYKQTSIYKHLDLLEHLIDDAAGVYKFKFINADQFLDVLDKARAMAKRHQRSFTQAYRSGLRIAMGTDAGTPFNFHGENAQELERMVALGMTAMNAVLSATAEAAELLGLQYTVGTIQPGRQADLLLVDGNPLKRIGVLCEPDRIVGVMKAGTFVSGVLAQD